MQYWNNPYTWNGRVANTFKPALPAIRPGPILDIGCSLGYTTAELAQHYTEHTVVGVEINEETYELAKLHHPQVQFIHGDGYNPAKLGVGKQQGIFLMNNLACLDATVGSNESLKAGVQAVLENMLHVLNDKGILAISRGESYIILEKRRSASILVSYGGSSQAVRTMAGLLNVSRQDIARIADTPTTFLRTEEEIEAINQRRAEFCQLYVKHQLPGHTHSFARQAILANAGCHTT